MKVTNNREQKAVSIVINRSGSNKALPSVISSRLCVS